MKTTWNRQSIVRRGLFSFLLFIFIAGNAESGMLNSIRKSVSGPDDQWGNDSEDEWPSRERKKRGRKRRRNRRDCHYCHTCEDLYDDDDERSIVLYENHSQDNNLWTSEFGSIVVLPYSLPRYLLGDDDHQEGYFARYPYFKNYYNMTSAPNDPEAKCYSGRIRLEYSADFQQLTRMGGQIQIETVSRLGIDTEAYRFEELIGIGKKDSLYLGDFNFTYRFAQSKNTNFRAGIGLNWVADSDDRDYGINLTYGFDFYPCKPWVFSSEFDLGTLGKSDLFRFRTTTGVMLHRAEAYVGYEYLDIGDSSYNGLIAGIRINF